MVYFFMDDLQKAATMIERALKHNPTMLGRYDLLAATYALLGRDQDSEAAYNKYLKIWGWASGAPDLTMLMNFFPLKDRKLADRLAEGFLKAGCPGEPSGYYKIYEEYRLTGEEIGNFVADKEITVHGRRETFWVNHNKNGRTLYRGIKAKWWIEDDRLCYQRDIGSVKDLKDCGEVYRNPDATPGSNKQYLHVKDYGIYALTAVE
jgi:tetratricopeptide (TPR) repeat protein